jgi:hypothetical protein
VVNTLDANDKGELGLGRNVERTSSLSLATETDLITFFGAVFTDILVSTLEDDLALSLTSLDWGKRNEKKSLISTLHGQLA